MKKTFITIVSILFALALWAERVHVFEDLLKPTGLIVDPDGKYLYITQFPHIHVYSAGDYPRVKSIGKEGEGPGEFLAFARPHFYGQYIIIHSQTKFSYFSRDWRLVKEHKVPFQFVRGVKPFGDKLVASYSVPAIDNPEIIDQVVVFHDWEGENIKEIFRKQYYIQGGKKINGLYLPEVLRRTGIRFFPWRDRVYVEPDDGEDGIIDVYTSDGKLDYTIKLELEKLKTNKEHIAAVEEWHRLRKRRLLQLISKRGWLFFGSHFPSVHQMKVFNDNIYIIPYKKKQGKVQLFIFDLKGKLLKHLAVPLAGETMFEYFPWVIHKGKLFQLRENQDEEWVLHAFDMSRLPSFQKMEKSGNK